MPIVAIDPVDARDHDDAIWAEADGEGGFRAVIAIADVSFYVRPGSEVDRDQPMEDDGATATGVPLR